MAEGDCGRVRTVNFVLFAALLCKLPGATLLAGFGFMKGVGGGLGMAPRKWGEPPVAAGNEQGTRPNFNRSHQPPARRSPLALVPLPPVAAGRQLAGRVRHVVCVSESECASVARLQQHQQHRPPTSNNL